jgi:hypothetical protein
MVKVDTRFEVGVSKAGALAWCRWAAKEMRIGRIYDETGDGFRAGNEWWDSYQLTVEVAEEGEDSSEVRGMGSSLKIGFEARLRAELDRFEELVAGNDEPDPDPGDANTPIPDDSSAAIDRSSERVELARAILKTGRVALANYHVSKVKDTATALHNMTDTAAGKPARRSSYGTAPGGSVWLSVAMLRGVRALAKGYRFRLSEIAGGSHSSRSRHYRGTAFDLDVLNGRPINSNHPSYKAFMAKARALGATEVLGPGYTGHDTHLHCAWPS